MSAEPLLPVVCVILGESERHRLFRLFILFKLDSQTLDLPKVLLGLDACRSAQTLVVLDLASDIGCPEILLCEEPG